MPAPELNPPTIPIPQTFDEAEQWLTENAVYGQTAPAPVRCEVPAIDVARASDAVLDATSRAWWSAWSGSGSRR